MDTVVLVAAISPIEGQAPTVRAAFEAVIPRVHAEPGCLLYALHETRHGFLMIEKWESKQALVDHGRGAPFTELTQLLEPLLAEPLSIVRGHPILVTADAKGQL
jgi:quinol monooxygenase YgiN